MKRFVLLTTVCLALVFTVNAFAANATRDILRPALGGSGMLYGEAKASAAKQDTFYLMGGSPTALVGKFEDAGGASHWQGFTSLDPTLQPSYWSVTDNSALVINGNYSAWCGIEYPPLNPPAAGPGYGNSWFQVLAWSCEVDPDSDVSVRWDYKVYYDSETGYDITALQYFDGLAWTSAVEFDGAGFSDSFVNFVVPRGLNTLQLRILFESDGAWSDADGLFPTDRGACQIDDIIITVNSVVENSEDFEDGTFGDWEQVISPNVGDFAAMYRNLGDLDICRSNTSSQAAFIDDGIVVPGTGGTICITWCYGPGGYIVNNTGGLAGPDFGINNHILSPILEWPSGVDTAYMEWTVYRHMLLQTATWAGHFYRFAVRSIDTGDPNDMEFAAWQSDNYVYYGGPDYIRTQQDLGAYIVPGATHVQIRLGVEEIRSIGGLVFTGYDNAPAPYFDDIALVAYPFAGPSITTRDLDVAQDNFPESGELNYSDLCANSVRFDMANSISPTADLYNNPGDTIFFDIVPIRAGSTLVMPPKMVVKMKANRLFESCRVLPDGFTSTPIDANWALIEGEVDGLETFTAGGAQVQDRFNFDLPDEYFFYPGDVIHYYIQAEDDLGGLTTLPGNLDWFGDFDRLIFNRQSVFVVRALPTMFSDTPGDQPKILFWNDAHERANENEWFFALNNIGYREGVNFDLYNTNGPSSGVGNGLGGRANEFQLEHYDILLYSVAYLQSITLSDGSSDLGDDIGVLDGWFGFGGKKAFFTGDGLIYDLNNSTAGQAFIDRYFSLSFQNRSIRALINNQTTPLVKAVPANGVINRVPEWIVYGGCLQVNDFDAVNVVSSTRLAEWTNPAGQTGVYTYSAASLYNYAPYTATTVYMPYDFMSIVNAPGYTPPIGQTGLAARAIILEDILFYFSSLTTLPPTDVTPDRVFAATNFPNPFNPKTTIQLNLPSDGKVSLKVYNVRGELVRTLVDGQLPAGQPTFEWSGENDQGGQAASGVYFYKAEHNGNSLIKKMALLK